MLPTVADVLALDAVRRGAPRVVAGADRLDARVRWVHVSELADIASLLSGGELVLTTGIALPDDPRQLRRYVAELESVGVSGIVLELGRKYAERTPGALVEAAEDHGVPLIALQRETPFVRITESVHARIIDTQLEELRAAETVHEVFTELSVEGAGPADVVRQVARMTGRPAVLENLAHQVLACEPAGAAPEDILDGWETRSRAVSPSGRTGYDETAQWLVTSVGARGQDWGRLILIGAGPPSPRHVVLAERAATTLALTRLVERQRESLERQTHRTILTSIVHHVYADPAEAALRARAVGVHLTGRRLLAAVLRPHPTGGSQWRVDGGLAAPARLTELTEEVALVCREAALPALVGALDEARVGILFALPTRAHAEHTLARLADRLRNAVNEEFVMAAGSVVDSVRDARRSFLEAGQVADVAMLQPGSRPFYRLPDMRLRGLLHLLRGDARLQTFVERELGPLLAYDVEHGTDLAGILATYLATGCNKAVAAKRAHLSRPALYERLRRIARNLDVDLDGVESCLSLHVALLALESLREDGTGRP